VRRRAKPGEPTAAKRDASPWRQSPRRRCTIERSSWFVLLSISQPEVYEFALAAPPASLSNEKLAAGELTH
jgi:hypothetical protein